MATIDIDLRDFDDEDVLERAIDIVEDYRRDRRLSKNATEQVKELIRIASGTPANIKNTGKVDEWKDELWPKIKERLTLERLEALING